MRKMAYLVAVVVLAGASSWLAADSNNPKAELKQKLEAQFVPVKLTADKRDVARAGSVLVLQKDGMLMCSVSTVVPPTRFYKDGNINEPRAGDMVWNLNLARLQPGATSTNVPKRNFMAGEKIWVSDITVRNEGVIFRFYSDPYDGTRYYGDLVFPFEKKNVPTAEDLLKTIAEVITVEDPAAAAKAPSSAPAEAAPAAAPPQDSAVAPIAPPPPPADAPPAQPKTINLGMTKEQVVAIFGPPKSVANLGAKEIDYYPDMKVTFVKGKVTDVQ